MDNIARELLAVAKSLRAGYPASYFLHSGARQKAESYGLIDVENEDLTSDGLIAKMREWQESEGGVESFIYNDAAKRLRAMGVQMPSGIRKVAMDFPTQDAMDKYLKEHPDADKSNHRVVEKKTQKPQQVQKKSKPLTREQEDDVADSIRSHLHGTDRATTEETMLAVLQNGKHKRMTKEQFSPIWKSMIDDEYLKKTGTGYRWNNEGTFSASHVARELLAVAKSLTAAMPSSRDGGRIKRAVGLILRKNGWSDYSIFESRNGSGYEIHAWRDVEQLPDISMVPGARTNDDLAREFDKEQKALNSVLERSLPIPAQEVVVNIRLNRQHDGTKAKLYAYLKYGEGYYVTPIEIL